MSLREAWDELRAEVGECDIDGSWCERHLTQASLLVGDMHPTRCWTGRAVDDMANAVESIIGRGGAHARNGCPHCTPDDTVPAIRCMRCGTAYRDEA